MNERSSKGKQKKEHDFALNAFRVVQEATGQVEAEETLKEPPEDISPEERHEAAVKLGRLGGKKGGKARAAQLSPERRREIAKEAAKARWQKKPPSC